MVATTKKARVPGVSSNLDSSKLVQCDTTFCSTRELQLSLQSSESERIFQDALGKMRQLFDHESTRLIRVNQILLEADNDWLHLQMRAVNEECSRASEIEYKLKIQLREAAQEIVDLQDALRGSARKVEDLKKEVIVQNTKLREQQSAMSEKQNLSKSLSDAQREIDRLKAQNASSQSILAEKLALERQLNSLEVQIQNERRAFERTRANDTKTEDGAMTRIQTQLTKMQAELATQVAETQRLEKDSQDKVVQWESEKKAMKDKIETLQRKLKAAKERLRETRQNTSALIDENEMDAGPPKQRVTFSRTTTAYNPDMTIATPGGVRFAEQPKRVSTALGEKSTFSITPYLARTSNIPDSPRSSSQVPDDNPEEFAAGTHDTGQLEHSTGIQNADESTIVGDSRREQPSKRSHLVIPSAELRNKPRTGQFLPKKRKLLNSQRDISLFEDEDVPMKLENPRVTLAPSGGKRGFGGLGDFSPLKRNKRI